MVRLERPFSDVAGRDSHLCRSTRDDPVQDESDWHEVFKSRMEEAGWTLKHEVVCEGTSDERIDFLGYHDSANTSYINGEWVGFELKYSDGVRTRAKEIAKQIEEKYERKRWLSSGEEVNLWVAAPFVKGSHCGTADVMTAARNREIEAASLLSATGFGYLHSWHPTPHIKFRTLGETDAFPHMEDWVHTPDFPAFQGEFDPWRSAAVTEYELEMTSEQCEVRRKTGRCFSYDWEEEDRRRQKYLPNQGGTDE